MPNFGFYDFSTGVNLLATPLSMNDNQKTLDWAEGVNVELQGYNGIKKMKGNEIYLDLTEVLGVDCKILAIANYKKNREEYLAFIYQDDTQAHLCIADGTLNTYKIVKSGLTKDAVYHITSYSNGIVISNGKQNSFCYFHEETPSIITCRTYEAYGIYPVATLLYKGRLYAFNDDKEGILYYSALGNPAEWAVNEDGSGGGYFAKISGSDRPIRALGDYGDALAIHREKQTILLRGATDEDFETAPFSDQGSISARGIVNYDNKQYYYDDGIYALQYSSLQQIQLSSEFSRVISPAFDNVLTANFKNMIALAYPPERQIWFFLSDSTLETDELNIVWIMDKKNKQVSWYQRKALPVTCACYHKGTIYTGTKDGKILKENVGTTLCGTPFSATWKSAWLKFGNLKYKSVEEGMDIAFDGTVANRLYLEYRFNTDPSRVRRRELILNQRGKAIWGQSKFGACNFRKKISPVKRMNVPGIFKSVQIGFTSTYDFSINALAFYDVSIEE